MNQQDIRRTATELERVLAILSTDEEVRLFQNAVGPVVAKAKVGIFKSELEWRDVPGAYFFQEGGSRKYPELEHAFAEFRHALTGGTP